MKARTRTIDEQLYKSIIVFAKQKIKTYLKTPLDSQYTYETLKVLEKVWMGPIVLRYKMPKKIDEIIKI